MGRKKKTSNGENTGNQEVNTELKTASEVLSKVEVKPEVKPETVVNQPPPTDNNVVIEARPIEPGELGVTRAEERRARKEALVRQVLLNVIGDFYNWLNTRSEAVLERYVTADPMDILIDRLTEATDDLYRRLMRFRVVTDRISRLIGGGGARGFTQRDLEQMIFERLASSIAGSMEQSIEAQRRRRIADEIIRELMSGQGQGKEQSEEGGGNQ
jgi:hypothetical protein